MKRTLFLIIALTLAVLTLSGLAVAKELNFALSGNPDTLDPHKTSGTLTFQTLKSVYDTLAEPDQSGKIVPALAEKWDISPDGMTWTFTLRKGVVFHNGDKLTSRDVKATFERIQAKETASPNANEFAVITAIETPDDMTVVLKLSAPSAPLLGTLASGWGAILPKGLIDSGHDFAAEPVGTGPFKMTQWVRDGKIVLEKNKNYWMKGLPKLDKVTMHIIPERAVQVQGLISGQVDVSYIIDQEDVPLLESSPDVEVRKTLTSLILVMPMNCSRPPLDNVKVRQAITQAIDKQKVLDVAYGGGKPIGTFMDYGNAYYKDFTDLYPYNPAKAKKMLAEAGVGKDTELEMFLPQNYPPHVKAGEIYQDMLTKVGLNVKIKLVDWSTWIGDVYRQAKYDLTVIGHTGKLDPNGTLANYGKEKRYVRWVNAKAAELIDKAAQTDGFENRKKLYDQALQIMAEEVPFMFLGSSYRRIGLRKNVSDFRMTPSLDTFDFRWTNVK
ncbi:MAG: ABC transporter substrate-binding protein [Deltaproteobacteria bacterium]|jgi:peptide/nickel transport system substrate-binding protein|nr:ABC transporter substrate-binding protein [Deltaproteobacteria bacterium]